MQEQQILDLFIGKTCPECGRGVYSLEKTSRTYYSSNYEKNESTDDQVEVIKCNYCDDEPMTKDALLRFAQEMQDEIVFCQEIGESWFDPKKALTVKFLEKEQCNARSLSFEIKDVNNCMKDFSWKKGEECPFVEILNEQYGIPVVILLSIYEEIVS